MVESGHPKASQIGADFSASLSIGVGLIAFELPITRCPDHRITRCLAALCLRPSATDPTPLDVLLKTKAKPKIERTVESLSVCIFHVFQGSNRSQFRLCFLVPAVRSAEGRDL
jgi:hypothetical protein